MNFAPLEGDANPHYNVPVQLWEHLKNRIRDAREARLRERDAIATPEALQAYVETFRQSFLNGLGGLPELTGEAPPVTVTGEVKRDRFTVQKLILETRPGVFATANFYLPSGQGGKGPAVLFLCGHSAEGKGGKRYRSIAARMASQGLNVLVLDPLGQGERLGYYDPKGKEARVRSGTGEHEYCGLQCTMLGDNLSRYLLHDAIRAVDYLSRHPAVDPARIGITGSSGGGTQTLLMMLLEPRLAAAAPTTAVTSRMAIFDSGFGQDAEQIWPGFSSGGYDYSDFLAAFAPKPLSVQSVTYDYFPIEGARSSVQEARRFWELLGCPQNLQALEDKSVHQYTDALAQGAAEFFLRHLGPGAPLHGDGGAEPVPEADLLCTQSGQILGDYPQARTVFVETGERFRAGRKASPLNRKAATEFLRQAVARGRAPFDLNLRIIARKPHAEVRAAVGYWWSQAGVMNSGLLLHPWEGGHFPVTVALWEHGTRNLTRHDAWIRREIRSGRAILIPDLTGMGAVESHPFNRDNVERNTAFRICDDLHTLGDSVAALRTHDLLQSLKTIPEWGGLDAGNIRLYGEGSTGLYAALASVLTGHPLEWENPMPTWSELLASRYYDNQNVKEFILPGLLRHADWPDLLHPPTA